MFESITISFEGDDNMSVNIMRILSLYLASLRCQKKLKPSEICANTAPSQNSTIECTTDCG